MEQIQENTESPIIDINLSSGKANIIIDASKIDLFQVCEARYNFRYNLRKALPIHEKSKSLDLGGLAHTGLEVYYNMLKEGKRYPDRMNACLMKIRETSSDPNLSAVDPDEVNILLQAVEESCDFWRHEDETFEILSVETPFAYVLFEDDKVRIIISGKIDLLVNKPQIGRNAGYKNLPYDHKTHSRNFQAPRLSNQFINYSIAAGSYFLYVNKIGLQKTLTAEEKYARVPYSYDPLIIADWKDNITKLILGRYLQCIADDEWVMNFTSCLKFNRLCEYYKICDASGKEAKLFNLSDYVDAEEWDVTKGLLND